MERTASGDYLPTLGFLALPLVAALVYRLLGKSRPGPALLVLVPVAVVWLPMALGIENFLRPRNAITSVLALAYAVPAALWLWWALHRVLWRRFPDGPHSPHVIVVLAFLAFLAAFGFIYVYLPQNPTDFP